MNPTHYSLSLMNWMLPQEREDEPGASGGQQNHRAPSARWIALRKQNTAVFVRSEGTVSHRNRSAGRPHELPHMNQPSRGLEENTHQSFLKRNCSGCEMETSIVELAPSCILFSPLPKTSVLARPTFELRCLPVAGRLERGVGISAQLTMGCFGCWERA